MAMKQLQTNEPVMKANANERQNVQKGTPSIELNGTELTMKKIRLIME